MTLSKLCVSCLPIGGIPISTTTMGGGLTIPITDHSQIYSIFARDFVLLRGEFMPSNIDCVYTNSDF